MKAESRHILQNLAASLKFVVLWNTNVPYVRLLLYYCFFSAVPKSVKSFSSRGGTRCTSNCKLRIVPDQARAFAENFVWRTSYFFMNIAVGTETTKRQCYALQVKFFKSGANTSGDQLWAFQMKIM